MALRRGFLWLLLCALVAAQTLGLLHRVVHAPGLGAVTSQAAVHPHDDGLKASDWTAKLFAGHEGDASCRLFDQLSGSGVAPEIPSLALPVLVAGPLLLWFQGEALVRWAALFDARGPPSLR